jgi:hypothetical protein
MPVDLLERPVAHDEIHQLAARTALASGVDPAPAG